MNRLILSIALIVIVGSAGYLMAQSQAVGEWENATKRLPDGRIVPIWHNPVSGDATPDYQKPAPAAQTACGPQYPYSQYHNPYYTGVSGREIFSDAADWIIKLPFSIMDRVSNIVDYRFFPRVPATHGGAAPQPPNGAQASDGSAAKAPQESH